MTTITIPGFIYATPADSWERGPNVLDGHSLKFIVHEGLNAPYVQLCPHTITFDLPEGWDPRAQRIDALRKEEKKLRADFHVRVTEIQAQINKLQALEMS